MLISKGVPKARISIHKIVRQAPNFTVDFPEQLRAPSGEKTISFPNQSNLELYPDPTDDLLRVETFKDIKSMAGRFTLGLSAHRFKSKLMNDKWVTWRDLIDPHDLVVIELGRLPDKSSADTPYTTVMVGFVDDIYFDRTISETGEPQYRLTITGTDLAEVMYDGRPIWIDVIGESPIEGLTDIFLALTQLAVEGVDDYPAKQADFVMQEILQRMVDFDVSYRQDAFDPQRSGDTGPTGDTITSLFNLFRWRFRSQETTQIHPFSIKFGQTDRNAEGIMRQVVMWPFNEFYTDMRTEDEAAIAVPPENVLGDATPVTEYTQGKPFGKDRSYFYYLMRPNPFPWVLGKDAQEKHFVWWDWLKNHASIISEADSYLLYEDAVMDHMSLTRREIRSAYFVTPSFSGLSNVPAITYMPLVYNNDLLSLYGFVPFDISTPIFATKSFTKNPKDPAFFDMWRKLTWQLASWNNNNQFFLSGSKVVRLRPDLKIGTVLLELSPIRGDRYFYIESVHHVWDFSSENSYTELGVTRGMKRATYDDVNYPQFLGQFLQETKNTIGDKLNTQNQKVANPTQQNWP